jgi:phosphoribosylamine---glycine ligase
MGLNVLIAGGGGREHALAWKIAQSPRIAKLYCAPGNAGIAAVAECVAIEPTDILALRDFAVKNRIDLTVVGPEQPLCLGIVDSFQEAGLAIFGPSQKASLLESSKIFAKKIMREHNIPTADFARFSDAAAARAYVRSKNGPLVIKADGLAAGKGVFPTGTAAAALDAIDRIMVHHEFGDAGSSIVVEDFLTGEEASFICFTDGKTIIPLPSSQDHKQVFDGDQGPNTGGMGAYTPAPVITPQLQGVIMKTVMYPVLAALNMRGIVFRGTLYAGLMIEDGCPRVLEFNARLGDPETQPLIFNLQTDLIDIMQAVISGRLSDITIAWDPRPSVCVVMASGGYPGNYIKGLPISGLAEASRVPDAYVFHAGTAIKDGAIVTAGGRVLGVTARGETIAEAIKTAYSAVDTIHWDGVHFRKDIAYRAVNRL